jgi:hypothetical protein
MIKETVIVRETHVKRGSRFVRKTKPNEKKMTGTQKIKRASWIILSLLIQIDLSKRIAYNACY